MAASSHSDQKPAAAVSLYTWIGIALALFSLIIVRQAVFYLYPSFTAGAALWRESLDWLCVLALFFIIRRGERLRLNSVGIGRVRWWKSFVWGVVGWPNVVNAFLLGLVLSPFYIWRRDLVANMIGHCLVDFISVVGPRLFS